MRLAGVPHYTVFDASAALLARVAALLEAEGIPYSLAYGTALGAARHGGFIPHDHDMDLFVPTRYVGAIRGIAQALGGNASYSDPPWGPNTYFKTIRFPGCHDLDIFTEDFLAGTHQRDVLSSLFDAQTPQLERILFCGRPFSIVPNYREHLDVEYGPDWPEVARFPEGELPLDTYMQAQAHFRQPNLRDIVPSHCIVPGVFDGSVQEEISTLARAWVLFGKVTAAVEQDDVVRLHGREPHLTNRLRAHLASSLRWVHDVVIVGSPEYAPSSYGPAGGSPAGVDRFFDAYDADFLLCAIGGQRSQTPADVASWYGHARSTGRLRTIDRSL